MLMKNVNEAIDETLRVREINESYCLEIERLNEIIGLKNNEI